jgi:hypothetical protein
MRACRTASRTAAALVTMAALSGSVQLASAPPAAALPGLERAEDLSGLRNLDSPKGTQASCPPGKVVVGGAEIEGGGEDPATQPRLTHLVPIGNNQFAVGAEAPNHNAQEPWLVRAYAICVDDDALDMSRYQIMPGTSAKDSRSFKDTEARCPDGTVAFGTGGMIEYPDFDGFPPPARVGLQLVRPSGPLDIGRAPPVSMGTRSRTATSETGRSGPGRSVRHWPGGSAPRTRAGWSMGRSPRTRAATAGSSTAPVAAAGRSSTAGTRTSSTSFRAKS